jgi:hypothetical protein
MKTLRYFSIIISLVIVSQQIASAQRVIGEMSASERNEYIRELYYADYEDLNLSTSEAKALKQDLNTFGNYLVKNGKGLVSAGLWVGLGGGMACAIVGGATKIMPIVYGSAAFLAGGIVLTTIGFVQKSKGLKLLDYSRMVIADASVYPVQFDNLAFGFNVSVDAATHFQQFGPSIAIRF